MERTHIALEVAETVYNIYILYIYIFYIYIYIYPSVRALSRNPMLSSLVRESVSTRSRRVAPTKSVQLPCALPYCGISLQCAHRRCDSPNLRTVSI